MSDLCDVSDLGNEAEPPETIIYRAIDNFVGRSHEWLEDVTKDILDDLKEAGYQLVPSEMVSAARRVVRPRYVHDPPVNQSDIDALAAEVARL